ncbi:MAG TPA: glycosyltransferase family 9 protein [Cytophagales bacterium]|nr:glycosyltransferase family 9 protein [Cytophagales bacterium]
MIIIALTEHIGDIVATEPVISHVKTKWPKSELVWITFKPYQQLIMHHPQLHSHLSVSCLTEWIILKKIISRLAKIYDLHMHLKHCSKYGYVLYNNKYSNITYSNFLDEGRSLLKAFSLIAGLGDMEDIRPTFYLNKKIYNPPTPELYIVIHTKSSSIVKDWDDNKWKSIISYYLQHNSQVKFVEIGLIPLYIDEGPDNYINMCCKLNFQQIALLIRDTLLFIGIDSGFAHIAHALETPKLVLIGALGSFKTYNPFSGPNKDHGLIKNNGPVKDIDTIVILNKIDRVLNQRLNNGSSSVVRKEI